MIAPPIPKKETQRQKVLASFNILDTDIEKDYDNLTTLAAEICGTSFSLVSFIDKDRQWFKSHYGIDISETPRECSFCAHAICEPDEIVIVEDTRLDLRFHDNPFVIGEPNIAFYAGVPLVTAEGFSLGTICVLDNKPHQLTEGQQRSLKALGRQAVNLLELRKNKSDLEKVMTKLKQKNTQLQEFTYIASHDLQEPLRTITSFIGYLKETNYEQLDENGQKGIEFIGEASERMSLLIKELLNYSLIGTKSNNAKINAEDMVNFILQDLNLLIKESKAEITCGQLPEVNAFPTEFRMLVQNLITNALKFSKKGCTPKIDIQAVEKNNFWEFAVSDQGIGIAPKHQQKIFQIFQRLHLDNEYKGTGIGLSHCQKIVELHGGEIWVESEEGEGSTFYFTLPNKTNESI